MRRLMMVGAAVLAAGLLGASPPPNPGPNGLYLGIQANIHPVVTPRDRAVTWGSAPPIDEHYGGTLYAGTSMEMQDPRPALVDGKEPLRLWVANPTNGVQNRPAIIWLHGGGFAVGIESMYALANSAGREYAQRGYVSFSVEYRTDTTRVSDESGSGASSLCQWVQDHENPGDPIWEARRAQCMRNIVAAQHDIQASVRWIRDHAGRYGVDPQKIAVGGFSAGAVTAASLAYRSDVGGVSYFPGDDRSLAKSRIQAAIGASGCLYSEDGRPLSTWIGAGDAPVSLIHSKDDSGVPYACVADTVETARSKGLVAELTSYCKESGHAAGLYGQHKAATDEQWTTFLARQLKLYTGMRAPTSAPLCPMP